jgi:hypothetical protein
MTLVEQKLKLLSSFADFCHEIEECEAVSQGSLTMEPSSLIILTVSI